MDTLSREPWRDGKASRADKDQDAVDEMEAMVSRRWLRKYKSKFQAKKAVRGKLALSELIVISKTKLKNVKNSITNNVKKRMILNLKKSGVTSVSVKSERPELPMMLDVAFSNLGTSSQTTRPTTTTSGAGLRPRLL